MSPFSKKKICGDPTQLSIGARIYSSDILQTFRAVQLETSKRAAEDNEFAALSQRIRTGYTDRDSETFTRDYERLRSRRVHPSAIDPPQTFPRLAMIITATRARRDFWNDYMEARLCEALPENMTEPFVFHARDMHLDGRYPSQHEAEILNEEPSQPA